MSRAPAMSRAVGASGTCRISEISDCEGIVLTMWGRRLEGLQSRLHQVEQALMHERRNAQTREDHQYLLTRQRYSQPSPHVEGYVNDPLEPESSCAQSDERVVEPYTIAFPPNAPPAPH